MALLRYASGLLVQYEYGSRTGRDALMLRALRSSCAKASWADA